jgi:type IV secretory pathway VirB6-like protein
VNILTVRVRVLTLTLILGLTPVHRALFPYAIAQYHAAFTFTIWKAGELYITFVILR